MTRFRCWLSSPQGALVYFGTCYTLVIVAGLMLSGCLTTEEALFINSNFDRVPTRSEIEAREAQIACKNMARNLVQIARCDVRR